MSTRIGLGPLGSFGGVRFGDAVMGVALSIVFLTSSYFITAGTITRNSLDYTYTLADWLINYSGGFVRRGLVGQFLLQAGLDRDATALAICITIVALTGGLLLSVFVLYRRTSRSTVWVMLCLSPAFTMFLYWSSPSGHRKELIGLLLVALAAIVVGGTAPRKVQSRTGIATLIAFSACFVPAILIHEVNMVYLPALAYIALRYVKTASVAQNCRLLPFAALAVAALTGFWVLVQSIARPSTDTLCQVLIDEGFPSSICSGTIRDLGVSAADAFRGLSGYFPQYFYYGSLFALAVLPLYLAGARRAILYLGAATAVLMLPEFIFGGDYGRWVFILVSALSLVTLSEDPRLLRPSARVPWFWGAVFILGWSVPVQGFAFGESAPIQLYRQVFNFLSN